MAEMQAAMTEMFANYDSDTNTSEESVEDDNGQGSEQDSGESETEEDTGSSGEGRTDEENNLRHRTAEGKTMGKGKVTLIVKKPLKRKQPRSKESKATDERQTKRPERGLQALIVLASEEGDSLCGSDDDKPRGRLNVRPEEDIPLVYHESSHTISDNKGGPALCDSPIPFPHSALQEEAAARKKKLNTAPPPASLAADIRSRAKTAPAGTNVFNSPHLTIKLRNPRAPLAKAPAENKDTKRPSLIIKLKANPIMVLQKGKSAVGSDGESEGLEHNGNEANEDSEVMKIKPRRVPTHKDNKTLSIGTRDERLLDIETKHSITGKIKILSFKKLARDQIDWKSKVHIDLIRTWRRQIYRRGGHEKRKESIKWHDEELSWLDQYFIDMLARIRNDTRIEMPTNKKTAVDFNAHFQGRVLFDSNGQPMEPRGRRAEPSIASQCTRRQAIKGAKEEADLIKASAPKGRGKGKIVIEVVSGFEQEAPPPAESNEQQNPDAGAEPNGDSPQRESRGNEKTLVAEAVPTTQGQKRKAQAEKPEDFQKPAKIKRWTTHEAVAEAKLARVRRHAATGRSIADNPPAEEPAVEKPAVEKPAIDRPITEQLARE